MKSKLVLVIAVLTILSIILGFGFLYRQKRIKQINSFEACAQAGYPIMEIYPPQCRTPDGRTFTAIVSPVPSPPGEICQNLCGDGTCQEIVCLGSGCPCPESPTTCPSDCQ